MSVCAGALLFAAMKAYGEYREDRIKATVTMLAQRGAMEGNILTTDEETAWIKEMTRLQNVWAKRDQTDIVPQLAAFLQSPIPETRVLAARMLGHLENPDAEPALTELLNLVQGRRNNEAQYVPPITLQLALARIQSRNLQGEARIEAVAEGVGLSLHGLELLSKHVNAPVGRFTTERSDGNEVMVEVSDLLTTMRQRGEPVDALIQRLTWTSDEKLKLQNAGLPVPQQVENILNYAASRTAITGDDEKLTHQLANLGPPAADAVIKRLLAVEQHPKQYKNGRGYVIFFNAAIETGDRRVLPLLKRFEKDSDKWLSAYATEETEELERQAWTASSPPLKKAPLD